MNFLRPLRHWPGISTPPLPPPTRRTMWFLIVFILIIFLPTTRQFFLYQPQECVLPRQSDPPEGSPSSSTISPLSSSFVTLDIFGGALEVSTFYKSFSRTFQVPLQIFQVLLELLYWKRYICGSKYLLKSGSTDLSGVWGLWKEVLCIKSFLRTSQVLLDFLQ